MQLWWQYVENRAIKQRGRGRQGDVTHWTSNSSARHALSFVVIAKDATKSECWLNICLTLRRTGLSASAEFLVFTKKWSNSFGPCVQNREQMSVWTIWHLGYHCSILNEHGLKSWWTDNVSIGTRLTFARQVNAGLSTK